MPLQPVFTSRIQKDMEMCCWAGIFLDWDSMETVY
jgi:hypothetical protein